MTQPKPAPLVDLEELTLAVARVRRNVEGYADGRAPFSNCLLALERLDDAFAATLQELRALRATAQTHAELVDALQWLPAGCTVDFFDEDMFLAECRDKGWSYPTPEAGND